MKQNERFFSSGNILRGIRKATAFIVLFASLFFPCCEDVMKTLREYNTYIDIVSVSPGPNATGIAINTGIKVVFGDDIDMATVDSSTFMVSNGTAAVDGSFSYDSLLRTVTFIPTTYLSFYTVYSVTLTRGIRNAGGNYLAADYSWSFTTAQYYFHVISVYPVNGEINVPVNSNVIAQFDDNIDISTVSSSTFMVDGGAGVIAGAYTIDTLLRTVTFNPALNLTASTLHTVTLTTGIKNPGGESMAADYTFSFTTGVALLPEVYLFSPLAEIFNGGSFDLGNQVNPGANTAVFTIGNSGTGPLNISGVLLSDNINFGTTLTTGTIAAGTSNSFDIYFNPDTTTGTKNASLTITSDDIDEGTFVINLTGISLAVPEPEIQITDSGVILISPTSTVDFGTITIGDTKTKTIVIHNIGSANLDVTGYTLGGTNPDLFSTTFIPPVTIAPGASENINISFSAPLKINARATITFQNNDTDEGSFVVKLKGRTMP